MEDNENRDINIALLIDVDNIGWKYTESILSELSKYGKVTIRRMYGDWSQPRLKGWLSCASRYSLTPIMQPNNTPGKNASDIGLIIDGKKTTAKIGSLISAKNSFQIDPINGYRINIIGYSKPGVVSEGGIRVEPKDFIKSYAIDKDETTYMVQFYKDKKFCGMVNIKFEDEKKSKK